MKTSAVNTFYFNTGVRLNLMACPPIRPRKSFGEIERGGTIQVPFQTDNVPSSAALLFLCDNPDLPDGKRPGRMVAKLLPGSGMLSEFAYFQVN